MWAARMDGAGVRIAGAVRAATTFTVGCWGDAFIPLSVLAAAQAARFAVPHLGLETPLVEKLELGAWALTALATVPALGALYRSAVGGRPAVGIGPAGVQWRAGEKRIAAALGVIFIAALALAVPVAVAGGAIFYPLRNAGLVHAPLLGQFSLGAVAAATAVLAVAAGAYLLLSRLSLVLPVAMAEGGVGVVSGWRLSRRWSLSLAGALALVELLPAAGLFILARVVEQLESGQAAALGGRTWPALDAWVAATVVAMLSAFVFLPMGVGARTWFYARGLAERRAQVRAAAPPVTAVEDGPDTKPADAGLSDGGTGNVVKLFPGGEAPEPAVAEEPEPELPAEPARPTPVWTPDLDSPNPEWIAPVAPLRGSALAQAVTVPVLLAHANDREAHPAWWSPPEHPEEPPVA
ncbi:hypothetical protein BH09PSE2_BH09PSE2_09750 [soil metagenome]